MSSRDQRVSALYRRYGPLVYRRALKILSNAAEAEEATQEIFIRAFKGIEKFDERSSLSTWLFRITTNHCLNVIRDRARRRELWEENVAPAEEHKPVTVDPTVVVLTRDLLAEADPQQAQAAVCVYMEGMSLNEAAEAIGVSRRSVTNLLNRFKEWAAKRMTRPPPKPPPGGT